MKKENTRNQEELVLEDALTQVIFNEKEKQDMVEDDAPERLCTRVRSEHPAYTWRGTNRRIRLPQARSANRWVRPADPRERVHHSDA